MRCAGFVAAGVPEWREVPLAKAVKIRRIGRSYGLIFSKKLRDELGIREGDAFCPVRTSDGFRLVRHDADFAAVVGSARDFMQRHRKAMSELAKR